MQRAVSWILDQQVRLPGDWSVKLPGMESGGWAFEQANVFYPDLDDTAVALLVLGKLRGRCGRLNERIETAIGRGVAWTLAMQSRNGGWGAFDKDNDNKLISKLPFCSFGEALDPPSADVTGHVLEALGVLGFGPSHPAVAAAIAFLLREQEEDGSWFGRWGVNHIYGTAAVLPALRAAGVSSCEPFVVKAADWVASKQNEDGGGGRRARPTWTPNCAEWARAPLRKQHGR
jgi:squalene-hopene/tetraprenyl-beta-curcumene cyclase